MENNAINTTATATATATMTIEEYNATMEKEAKKRLSKALFNLFNNNRVAFLNRLQFTEKNAVKAFETEYIGKDADGKEVTLTAKVKFTVFHLWNADNDAKGLQRKAIKDAVSKIADMASATPDKCEKEKAVALISEVFRLLGFGDYSEKLNATDAKKILCNAYKMTDNGLSDAKESEVKRSIQAVLYRLNAGKDAVDVRKVKKEAKTADSKKESENK